MVRIGTPKNIDNYIKIDSSITIIKLAREGIMPIYKDRKYVYYRKNDDIIKFMEKEV